MNLTTDDLKSMAAANVASMKMDGTSLVTSITKTAMDNDMNPDQVKRLVETTNQMAYLSELDTKDDRTFEFDVAKYDDVIDGMLPSSDFEKAASARVTSAVDLVSDALSEPMEKVAADKTINDMDRIEKIHALEKIASVERRKLDDMLMREHSHLVKFATLKESVKRDPESLEKMAQFDNALDMTKLVFGHDKVASDVRKVWSPEQLAGTKELSDHVEFIKVASVEAKELQGKVEKAEALVKEAFVAAGLRVAATAIKSAAPKIAKGIKGLPSKGKRMASGIKAKGATAFKAFDAATSTNEVSKGAKRTHNAWSSIRG